MSIRRFTPFALALALVACAEEAPEADGAAEAEVVAMTDEEAIAALADYWETHFNLQHPEMVASKYTDEAWVAPAEGGWYEGREQIQGWVAENSADAPTVQITPMETVVLGDKALGMGSYSISTTGPDGSPMTFSGSYMNELAKVDGEWMIAGSMSNYDSERPEEWEWTAMPEGDAPETIETELSGMIDAFEAAFNSQDAAGVADLYADGALAAFSNGPIHQGPAGIESGMGERMPDGVDLTIHQVAMEPIDGDLWSGGGWYEMAGPDGSTVQTGLWWNAVRMTDGSPEIVWTLTNAFPMEM